MLSFFRKRIIAIIIGLSMVFVVLLITGLGLFFLRPGEKNGPNQVITIKEGLSLNDVAQVLEKKQIITNKSIFMLWARVMGYSRKIKAGEYKLSSSMAPIRILEILTRGIIITHPVTIPEGYNGAQIAELLSENQLIKKDHFLSLLKDSSPLEKYGISSPTLEGYLYPDTYHFGKGLSAESIINTMIDRFYKVIEPFKDRIDEQDLSIEEIVTLASIVEKETGKADERPIIASVFLNRLKKNMRLESDPTVIYGMDDFSGNITRKDLANPTKYNTYIIRGLPPGPIANPGLDSIKAILYPSKTDYFYFVSKNNGSHQFSKTLQEHNRAVKTYQKRRGG